MLHGKLVFFLGWRLLFWAATAGVAPVLGSSELGGAAPHTSFLAFSFLTCAVGQLADSLSGSAHVISCFFLFWRVLHGNLWIAWAAPHTSFLAFFFLTCAKGRLVDSLGGSAHAVSCFFLFDVCFGAEGNSPCHAKSHFSLSGMTFLCSPVMPKATFPSPA